MSDFAVTITCKLNSTDTTYTTFVLDKVNDTTISMSSTITGHPVVNGDEVADHLYKEPMTLSLNGMFSLNGSKGLVVDGNGSHLENVQEMFEKIKNEGIVCEIVKVKIVNENGESQPRFKTRSNMILKDITWNERINSLGFSFGFRQILVADVEIPEVDVDDTYLPSITEPNTLNFTDTLINWDSVDSAVMKALIDFDLIKDEFLQYLKSMTASRLIGLGVAVAVATTVATLLAATGVGALIVGAVAGAIAIAVGMYNYFKKLYQRIKYRIEQFNYYKDDKKNKAEVERFSNFVGQIHTQLSALNNVLKVYAIASNEPQECMLSIDNNYYIFTFTKNNIDSQKYSLKITDIDEKVVGEMSDITAALKGIDQCTSQNYVFRIAETGNWVYLISTSEDTSDLSTYMILVSQIDLDDYSKKITEIIKNALVY